MEKPNAEQFLKTRFKEFLEIRAKHLNIEVSEQEPMPWLKAAMEEYGKQMFNYALELAANNAKAQLVGLESNPDCEVDKESILKLKI